jgi:hypothetical protein
MSWLRKIASFSLVLALPACGVKGDPLPPEKPTELGRGRPTYRRASEEIVIEKSRRKPVPAQNQREEDEDDDKE